MNKRMQGRPLRERSVRRLRFAQLPLSIALLGVILTVALVAPARAQATHWLYGYVTNSRGQAIPGAHVSAQDFANGWNQSTDDSDGAGYFAPGPNPANTWLMFSGGWQLHDAWTLWFDVPGEYRDVYWGGVTNRANAAWCRPGHSWDGDDDGWNCGTQVVYDIVKPVPTSIQEYRDPKWFAVPTSWVNRAPRLICSASDGGVGVKDILYQVAPQTTGVYGSWVKQTGSWWLGEGAWQVRWQAMDYDYNWSSLSSVVNLYVDLTKPVTNTSGLGEWARSVKLVSTDSASGVNQVWRTIDGGVPALVVNGVFDLPTEGTHTFTYWSTDKAGNIETAKPGSVKTDLTPPRTTMVASSRYLTGQSILLESADSLSGVQQTLWRIGENGSFNAGTTAVLPSAPGTYLFTYYSIDKAENAEAENKIRLVIEAVPGSVAGVVSDKSGDPLSGVTVSIPGLPVATTAPDGSYSITGLAPGTYVVSYVKSGYVTQNNSVLIEAGQAGSKNVVLELATGSIAGVVSAEGGAPLAGVKVSIPGYPDTTSAADGSYSIAGIVPGPHSVTFSKTGYSPYAAIVSVEAGNVAAKNVTLQLATGTLVGVVSGPSGALAGVAVSILGGGTSTTAPGGGYSISLAPGTYQVSYLKSGYVKQTATVIITAGAQTVKKIRLAVAKTKPSIRRQQTWSSKTLTRKRGVASLTLSSLSRTASGAVLKNTRVYLQTSRNGRNGWRNSYTLATSSRGVAAKALKLRTKGTVHYRWCLPASATRLAAYSTAQKVVVR